MSKIKENLANNISELRKMNNMTQQELAEKLNYTDKAISKWERGESTPDIESLSAIAKLFNLTVDDLLNDSFDKEAVAKKGKTATSKSYAKIALAILTIWLIGTSIFVYGVINNLNMTNLWMSFVWPVPASCLLTLAIAFRKKYIKLIPYAASGTLWTFLGAFFIQMLVEGNNIWIIFLVGIPLQAIVIITYWINV